MRCWVKRSSTRVRPRFEPVNDVGDGAHEGALYRLVGEGDGRDLDLHHRQGLRSGIGKTGPLGVNVHMADHHRGDEGIAAQAVYLQQGIGDLGEHLALALGGEQALAELDSDGHG